MTSPFKALADGVSLRLRLMPNGGRDAIDGIETDANGDAFLKARVSAVPEDGKANKALVALLAKRLKIAKSAISVVSGETARKKILRIEGDPEDVIGKIESLLKG